jgi:Yip1 domain
MNRLAGIVVAVIGLLVAVLSVLKVVPGVSLTSVGVALILLGGLIIGLSFVSKPDPEGAERMSTPATLLNIFVSPAEVFQNLRRHPRWLAAVIVMAILSSIFTNLFFNRVGAETIANFTVDKTLQMSMIQNNEDARKQVEAGRAAAIEDAKNPVSRAGQAVTGFVGTTFGMAFLALIYFLFALAMGGTMNYWQAFAAAVYASFPIAVIRFVLSTIILHIKDPTDIHPILGQNSLITDNLGVLFSPADYPVVYSVLSAIGILSIYWIWLTATGITNTGERVASSVGWTAALSIFGLLLVFLAAMGFLFPSFIS